MEGAWTRRAAADGVVRVWLPPGATLEEDDGYASWSPDPGLGRFSVTSAEGGGGGDELLAAERDAGAVVEVEEDVRLERGGLAVRRLRYRSRRTTPREVIDRGAAGRMHGGEEDVETLADFVLIEAGGRLIRAGYVVEAHAAPEVTASLQAVSDRLEIGDEGR
jgi:hypothetical protein